MFQCFLKVTNSNGISFQLKHLPLFFFMANLGPFAEQTKKGEITTINFSMSKLLVRDGPHGLLHLLKHSLVDLLT